MWMSFSHFMSILFHVTCHDCSDCKKNLTMKVGLFFFVLLTLISKYVLTQKLIMQPGHDNISFPSFQMFII